MSNFLSYKEAADIIENQIKFVENKIKSENNPIKKQKLAADIIALKDQLGYYLKNIK